MAKPNPNHIILLDLIDGRGFTEKGQTLLVNDKTGGAAAYLYDKASGDLVQIIFDSELSPCLSVIAKNLPLKSLQRHIYRRHAGWFVRVNNLGLEVDSSGLLT